MSEARVTRARGRPALFSSESIVAAAIDLIEENGVDAFTMRELAGRLGAAPSSAYRHVPDREALLGMAADAVLSKIEIPATTDWYEGLARLELNIRGVLRQYPGVAEYIVKAGPATPSAGRLSDALYARLTEGGVKPAARHLVFKAVFRLLAGELIVFSEPQSPREDAIDFLRGLEALLRGFGLEPTKSAAVLTRRWLP